MTSKSVSLPTLSLHKDLHFDDSRNEVNADRGKGLSLELKSVLLAVTGDRVVSTAGCDQGFQNGGQALVTAIETARGGQYRRLTDY